MKTIGIAFGIALTIITAAQAQSLPKRDCNASNIAAVAEAIAKMPDNKQKKIASDEIGAASEAMAQNDIGACKDHLLKASLQTK
jgi:hypothetical protein